MDEPIHRRGAPDTVVEAVAELEAEGYEDDLHVRDAGVHCSACGHVVDAHELAIDRLFRFEGNSDPDDESIVLGLSCSHCGVRGILVTAYGSAADQDEVAVLRALLDRRRT